MAATTPKTSNTLTLATEVVEASGPVADLADRVADGRTRLILERDGKAVAAVVSTKDLERLRQLDERRAELRQSLAVLAEPFKDLPPEEIQREVDRAISESRARRGRARPARAGARSADR